MDTEVREVKIPHDVLVRCPLVSFDLKPAVGCDGCKHFEGLGEHFPDGGAMAFHQTFTVRCAYPTDRELFRVVLQED